MPKTLSQFGRSVELISNDNPEGIFDVCRECRDNDWISAKSKKYEYVKHPKCKKNCKRLQIV